MRRWWLFALALLVIGLFVFSLYSERHYTPLYGYVVSSGEYNVELNTDFLSSYSTFAVLSNSGYVPDLVVAGVSTSPSAEVRYCYYRDGALVRCASHSLPRSYSGSSLIDVRAKACGRYLYVVYVERYRPSSTRKYWRMHVFYVDLETGSTGSWVSSEYSYYRSSSSDYESGWDDIYVSSWPECYYFRDHQYMDVWFAGYRVYSSSDGRTEEYWEYYFPAIFEGGLKRFVEHQIQREYHTESSSGSYYCSEYDWYWEDFLGFYGTDWYWLGGHDHEESGDCDYDYFDTALHLYRNGTEVTSMSFGTPVRSAFARIYGIVGVLYLGGSIDRYLYVDGPAGVLRDTQSTFVHAYAGDTYYNYAPMLYKVGSGYVFADEVNRYSPVFYLPSGIPRSGYVVSPAVSVEANVVTVSWKVYRAPPLTHAVDYNVLGVLDYDNGVSSVPVSVSAVPVYPPESNVPDVYVGVYLDGSLYSSDYISGSSVYDTNVYVGDPGDHSVVFVSAFSSLPSSLDDLNMSTVYTYAPATVHVLSKPYNVHVYVVAPTERNIYVAATAEDDDVNSPLDLNYSWRYTLYFSDSPPVDYNGPHTMSFHLDPSILPELNSAEYIEFCVTVTDPVGLSTERCGAFDLTTVTENTPMEIAGPPERVLRVIRRRTRFPVHLILQRVYSSYGLHIGGLSVAPEMAASLVAVPVIVIALFFLLH